MNGWVNIRSPLQPPGAGAFSLTPVLPDDELGDPFSFEGIHSSPTHAQYPCSTCKSSQDLWSRPYPLRAEALWVNPRKAYPPLVQNHMTPHDHESCFEQPVTH